MELLLIGEVDTHVVTCFGGFLGDDLISAPVFLEGILEGDLIAFLCIEPCCLHRLLCLLLSLEIAIEEHFLSLGDLQELLTFLLLDGEYIHL